MKPSLIAAALALTLAAVPQARLQAQAQKAAPTVQKPSLPSDMIPPPGMCRVWLKDVPAKQQPAPTSDCSAAMRTKPANAVMYYGNDYVTTSPKPPVKTTTVVTGGSGAKTVVSPQTVAPVVKKPPVISRGGG